LKKDFRFLKFLQVYQSDYVPLHHKSKQSMDAVEESGQKSLVITEKTIDIRSIVGSKNARLARLLPGFVYAYLNRIVHVDKINKALWDHRYEYDERFATAILNQFGAKINIVNEHNIPLDGKWTLASNHPLGGLDGLALLSTIGKKRKVVSVSNDLLMFLPNLCNMFLPVNKHGKNTEHTDILRSTFASDVLICFFPAGLVSRRQGKVIKDLEWKITFITQSVRNKRNLIPVFIDGHNSNFFYNLAYWRKKLGIKTNIEMLYLVDEMVKQQNKEINIIFGDPISYKVFDKSKKPVEWTELFKEHVYALGAGKPGVLPTISVGTGTSKKDAE
jgi:putative hemolysin